MRYRLCFTRTRVSWANPAAAAAPWSTQSREGTNRMMPAVAPCLSRFAGVEVPVASQKPWPLGKRVTRTGTGSRLSVLGLRRICAGQRPSAEVSRVAGQQKRRERLLITTNLQARGATAVRERAGGKDRTPWNHLGKPREQSRCSGARGADETIGTSKNKQTGGNRVTEEILGMARQSSSSARAQAGNRSPAAVRGKRCRSLLIPRRTAVAEGAWLRAALLMLADRC